MKLSRKVLTINGVERAVVYNPEKDSLAVVLRRMGLTGTKIGCGTGVCGACSVILDGKVIRSCTRRMKSVPEYSNILTIEGIGTPRTCIPCGKLGSLTAAHGVASHPGLIVSATGFCRKMLTTREEVREWFEKHRNVCRAPVQTSG